MIDTYQTSFAPPRRPPGLDRSHPILIPAPLPAQGSSKHLIRFLVVVAVLHLLISVATFIYFFHKDQMLQGRHPSSEKQLHFYASDQKEVSLKASARMIVQKQSHVPQKTHLGVLHWDPDHSVLQNIHLHKKIWLTILHPGNYYIYSRVTFSKGDPVRPLVSLVKMKESEAAEEMVVMQSFCSMQGSAESIPGLCTATLGEMLTLKKGNQLSVWVQDVSLVNYDETSTTFGAYKL